MVAVILSLVLSLPLASDTLEIDPELLSDGAEMDLEEEAALLHEHLATLAATGVDLNLAEEADLLSLPGLTVQAVYALISFRSRGGRFRGRDDLVAAGLSDDDIEGILSYVRFDSGRRRRHAKLEVTQRMARRLQTSAAYTGESAAYVGDPNSFTTRLKVSVGSSIRAGLIVDKDPGEPFGGMPPRSFDFVAGYVHLEKIGPFQSMIVGDYTVRLGEGLILRQGASGGGFVGASSIRPGGELRPHTSTSESGYFRGVAVRTRELFGASLGVFASRRRLDGRADSTGHITLLTTGLHRTVSERAARDAIGEEAAGAVFAVRRSAIRAGVASYFYRHEPIEHRAPFVSRPLTTAFLTVRTSTFLTSLETAMRNSSLSTSAAFEYEPAKTFSLSARWWRTERTTSILHTTVAATGAGRAEHLFDAAFRATVSSQARLMVRSYYRRTGRNGHAFARASGGADARLDYQPRPWISAILQLRERHAEIGDICISTRRALKCTEKIRRRALRLQLEYHHSRTFRARMRAEWIGVQDQSHSHERGILLFEDIRWRLSRSVQINVRLALFDTAGYQSRVYIVEDDVLYAFSSPALAGRGRRAYALLNVNPVRRLSFQLKYAATTFEDVNSIGSGRDRIDGSRVSDLKVQVRWMSR